MRHVAVVGGSLAGLSAARALRSQGFDGALTVVGAERHRPYDRPPLSKSFLAGTTSVAELGLETDDEDLGVDWRIGVAATALDLTGRSVGLSDGSSLVVDGVVVATGAAPHRPFGAGLAGVHTLRTIEDALSLQADLVPGARVVVVGAGFVGSEVASTASALGCSVTIIEAAATALAAPLGAELGAAVSALHSAHGVTLSCGVPVARLVGAARVSGVELADGRVVPADAVVVGVGVSPVVDWLSSSGLEVAGGVRCDAYGATSVPQVVAVGDCASWFSPVFGECSRLEHWTGARERAPIAVASLLSGGTERRPSRPPYVWSDQYGVTIQLAGHTRGADSVTIEEGSATDGEFLAVYRRDAEPVAVLAVGYGKPFMRWRKQLAAAAASSPVAP